MPTSRAFSFPAAPLRGLLLACLLTGSAGMAKAFDADAKFNPEDDPQIVLRFGFNALKAGNVDQAMGAFRHGAERNDLAAQWKLARMLQQGVNGEQNDLGAYELYARIADRFRQSPPASRDLPFVSHAVTMLGIYSLNGIEGTRVVPNGWLAEDYFYRAAALYKDPEAQYRLGSLYSSERLGAPRPTSAARWLGLAARKGHPLAQARLGEMLFYGQGVKRKPVRGLVYLSRAAKSGVKMAIEAQHEATEKASDAQREAAETIVAELDEKAMSSVGAVANAGPVGGRSTSTSSGN